MNKRILALLRYSPYESATGYRVPLVADTLDTLVARGAERLLGVPESWSERASSVRHVALPEAITASPPWPRFVTEGAPRLARLAAGREDGAWWRELQAYAPDLVVAVNSNSLTFAGPIARRLGAPLVLFSLGGMALGSVFHSRGAFSTVFFEFYAPLFLGVDALVSVEDSTALHAMTPVAHLPPARRLHVPIPHRTWPERTRQQAEQVAGLPPLSPGQRRVSWSGRIERVKRPDLFLEIARHLDPARYQIVVAGGDPRETHWVDMRGTEHVIFPGLCSNERLEAIAQASDLCVFTARISVAGTIFRETVQAGIPIATTVEPTDLLLSTLLDVERDAVMIDSRDPSGAARAIAAALEDPGALRARADSARRHVSARGQHLVDFKERVADFLLKMAK